MMFFERTRCRFHIDERNFSILPVTPRGFRDVLPQEARWRENITTAVSQAFALWGYMPIETPTLEILEVLEQGGAVRDTSFRLFDTDNELLVLRPDVTLPIARMVASRLDSATLPLRFRYAHRVFREEESLRAAAREFMQIGIESIGLSGPAADAEVVLLLIEAMEVSGLKDFTVTMCTVGVLHALFDAVIKAGGVDELWRAQMLAAYRASNQVEIERLAKDERVDERFCEALQRLNTINGSRDAIEEACRITEPLGCQNGLDDLRATWDIIEGLGQTDKVRIDFSVMSEFDYYTGLMIAAFAPGVGTAIGSGGRYDRMLEAYGKNSPAAGFAFSLETVMHALLIQGCTDVASEAEDACRVAVTLPQGSPAAGKTTLEVFKEAERLRKTGVSVVVKADGTSQKHLPKKGI